MEPVKVHIRIMPKDRIVQGISQAQGIVMVCKVRKEESACVIGWILTARPGRTVSSVQQSAEFHPKDFRFRDGYIAVMTIEAQVKIGLVIGIGRSRGGNIIG